MSATTGKIQPVKSGPWGPRNSTKKMPSQLRRSPGSEGCAAAKAGADRAGSGDNFPLAAPEFSSEVAQEIQSFLKENMGIELNFVQGGDGRTVVEVLDSNTGKVIRQIPREKVALFRDKMKELRGILFDGKA